MEPVLGRKFHLESEFEVKHPQFQHPKVEHQDKRIQNKYVFVSKEQAQQLLTYEKNQFTAIEIRLKPEVNPNDFAENLQKRLGMPVRVVNDANCFALSEALHGAGKGYAMVLGIILGTGMGGGLVLDGKLWSGSQGIAGEWGHATVNPEGPACYCGRRGCQELYLSGTGIQRMYRERTGSDLGVQQIFEASQVGNDADAVQVMEIFLETFGQALGNLVMCLDPDVIVIGGGVSNLPILYKEGLQRVSVQVFQGRQNIRIVQNQLGDSSGVYGAAAAAGTTV